MKKYREKERLFSGNNFKVLPISNFTEAEVMNDSSPFSSLFFPLLLCDPNNVSISKQMKNDGDEGHFDVREK